MCESLIVLLKALTSSVKDFFYVYEETDLKIGMTGNDMVGRTYHRARFRLLA